MSANKSKGNIKSLTKTMREIKEGKYDKSFKSGLEKKRMYTSIGKFIRDEQKQVEKIEKRGVGGAGRRISETPKAKKPRLKPFGEGKEFYKKGGTVTNSELKKNNPFLYNRAKKTRLGALRDVISPPTKPSGQPKLKKEKWQKKDMSGGKKTVTTKKMPHKKPLTLALKRKQRQFTAAGRQSTGPAGKVMKKKKLKF